MNMDMGSPGPPSFVHPLPRLDLPYENNVLSSHQLLVQDSASGQCLNSHTCIDLSGLLLLDSPPLGFLLRSILRRHRTDGPLSQPL